MGHDVALFRATPSVARSSVHVLPSQRLAKVAATICGDMCSIALIVLEARPRLHVMQCWRGAAQSIWGLACGLPFLAPGMMRGSCGDRFAGRAHTVAFSQPVLLTTVLCNVSLRLVDVQAHPIVAS